jgi:hypothetical protein
MNTAIEFKRVDMEQERQIFKRVQSAIGHMLPKDWRPTLSMDLAAVNADGELDAEKLLAFPDVDFFHDICGIMRHMDRSTGRLQDFFSPRCARR